MISLIRKLYCKYRRLFWFCVSGGTNTLLDYAIYVLLLWLTPLRPEWCHVFGYIAGIICSFNMNRHLTFRAGGGNTSGQAVRFVVVNGVTLGLSTLLLHFLLRLPVNPYFIKIPVTLAISIVSYCGYRFFAFTGNFKKKDSRDCNGDGSNNNKGEAAHD